MQCWQYGKGLFYLSSIFRVTKLAFLRGGGGGGGGLLNKCLYIRGDKGRLHPKVQPLTLYTPFFYEKVLLSHTLY